MGGWRGDVVGWRGEAGPTGPSQGVTRLNKIIIACAMDVMEKKRKNYMP